MTWRRAAVVATLALVAAQLGLRLVALERTAINWDEFALLRRVAESATSGVLDGGGRPGAAVLVLLPLVSDCADPLAVARAARLLWTLPTLLVLAGYVAFLWLLARPPEGAVGAERERGEETQSLATLLGVGLYTLVPAFARSSLEVRTDQLGLAGALLGGVTLLASVRRGVLAPIAGALFALGYLATQKALYVAGLTGTLALARAWYDGELTLARVLSRAGGVFAGSAVVVLGFEQIVALSFDSAKAASWSGGQRTFSYYRERLGYGYYARLAPYLLPHALFSGLLLAGGVFDHWRQRPGARRELALPVLCLTLGIAVAVFHASAMPYFWLTLGLFASTLGATTLRWLAPLYPRAVRLALLGALSAGLVGFAPEARRLLDDDQRQQKAALDFIAKRLPEDAIGFHPESALFCRAGGLAFPTYFWLSIRWYLSGPENSEARTRFIAKHRALPVLFLLESHRLGHFPPEIIEFWNRHYVRYQGSVFVLGRRLEAGRGEPVEFEALATGDYTWTPELGSAPLLVDGTPLAPHARRALEAGRHTLAAAPGSPGMLHLSIDVAPDPLPVPFYSLATRAAQ
jgi:hypothetical protein